MISNCPNCSAPIVYGYDHNCPYCNTFIKIEDKENTDEHTTRIINKKIWEDKIIDFEVDTIGVKELPFENSQLLYLNGTALFDNEETKFIQYSIKIEEYYLYTYSNAFEYYIDKLIHEMPHQLWKYKNRIMYELEKHFIVSI